jgi:hypothetical protein
MWSVLRTARSIEIASNPRIPIAPRRNFRPLSNFSYLGTLTIQYLHSLGQVPALCGQTTHQPYEKRVDRSEGLDQPITARHSLVLVDPGANSNNHTTVAHAVLQIPNNLQSWNRGNRL